MNNAKTKFVLPNFMGLLLTLSIGSLLGCADRNTEGETHARKPATPVVLLRLTTKYEVQAAINAAKSHRHAIIMVYVAWAPMIEQQSRFAEFQQAFRAKYPNANLVFRCIDCTPINENYEPLRALSGWKELEQARGGGSLLHGDGELVWINDGRVLLVRNPLHYDNANALVAQAEMLAMIED
jgi:hypothetical protein